MRAYLDEARALGREKFVRRVPRPAQQGAMPTGQPGEVVAPIEYDDVQVDLSTPDGMKAVGEYQTGLFQLRVKHGLAAPDEAEKMVGFRRRLDQLGLTQDFEKAMQGDPASLARISKAAGLEDVARIAVGFDEIGSPDLYAFTRKSDGKGGMVESKVPIGHLAASLSKEFYDATVGTAQTAVKERDALRNNAADRTYKADSGYALRKNAETNSDRLSARVLAQGEYSQFETIAGKNEGRAMVPVTVTDMSGEVFDVKDTQYDGMIRRIGGTLINTDSLDGAQAYNVSAQVLSRFGTAARGLHERDVQSAQAALAEAEKTNDRDAVRKARRDLDKLTTGEGPVRNWMRYREQMVEKMLSRATAGNQAIPAE